MSTTKEKIISLAPTEAVAACVAWLRKPEGAFPGSSMTLPEQITVLQAAAWSILDEKAGGAPAAAAPTNTKPEQAKPTAPKAESKPSMSPAFGYSKLAAAISASFNAK